MNTEFFPPPPEFDDKLLSKCKKEDDFMPYAFEWSKYIGILYIKAASIELASPGVKDHDPINIAILHGLLNRCSRLTLSMIHLASNDKFGETIRIIFRCLVETQFKIQWLIKKKNSNSFKRYLINSLDSDSGLKSIILNNIRARNNKVLVIEKRMLKSIDKSFNSVGIKEEEIKGFKNIPNFRQICKDIDYDDYTYFSVQRMGSQAIHGTWSDLLANYLIYKNGKFDLKDSNVTSHIENYFTSSNLFAMDMFITFINYLLKNHQLKNEIIYAFNGIKEEVLWYRDEAVYDDCQIID